MNVASFDHAADRYDASFSNTQIGKLQRERVYHWLSKSGFLSKSKSIFEINCGTGVDAEYFAKQGKNVYATDISPEMISYAKSHRSSSIHFEVMDAKNVDERRGDAIFSNFGGLNCLSPVELRETLRRIGSIQRSGDQLALVIMPKICLMESMYMLFRFKWKWLFRRKTDESVEVNVDGVMIKTWYYFPHELKEILRPDYEIKIKPVAFFLPPSYMENTFKKFPAVLSLLSTLEKTFGRLSYLASFSDHFILIAQRR
ncbi:MAG: class I SAM-dependent methyltransferase [Flavobacteriia bacterium]|nr:class I SAM-dependent methyltransferase [Flavobacteriia bacterium]